MQQPSQLGYYYSTYGYNQDGPWIQEPNKSTNQCIQYYSSVALEDGHGMWQEDMNKTNHQYPSHWDNSAFHVAGVTSYNPGQVQGGGQNRVQVPQQQPQPSQPTPTSTPPGGIHGEMNKQQGLMANQAGQINYVQNRAIAANPNYPYPRTTIQTAPQIRPHGHGRATTQMPPLPPGNYMPVQGVLTPSGPTGPAIVQTLQASPYLMFQQPRPGAPYNNSQAAYMLSQHYNYAPPANHAYYQQVLPQTYSGMSAGGPSPQPAGQQAQVTMMRPPAMGPTAPVPAPLKVEPKKRPNAIKIIDPNTHEEISVENDGGNNNNVTPTRSNDSSARETPQPNAGVHAIDNAVAAEFAAKVAARAMAPESQTQTEPVQQDILPVAISDSELHHKQQPPVVPNSDKISNTVLKTTSEEFVPRLYKQNQQCEPLPIEEPVPTVSAEIDSPGIEIQRAQRDLKEQFPALKNPVIPSPIVVAQSPLKVSKKQKSTENERQQASISPVQTIQVSPPLPPADKEVTNNRKGSRGLGGGRTEEIIQPPKERREKTKSVSKEQSPTLSPVITQEMSSLQEVTKSSGTPVQPTLAVAKEVKSNTVIPHAVAPEESPVVAPVPVSKASHQNGETPLPEPSTSAAVDGNKASRQKGKKAGKMRDLNRKGVEKEGSDMDAFTTEPPAIVNEEKERPTTPISSVPAVVRRPPTPPPTIEPVPPPTPVVDKIQEDLEEKEDKSLVAVKNEENNMAASAPSNPEEEPTPVVERPAAQLTLKHSYKKDQWSPLNPEGKKKYEREFLMGLKSEPASTVKPDNLPDVVAVIRDSTNNMRNQNIFLSRGDIGGIINPPFAQRNSQSQKGPLPKRGSMGGNKGRPSQKVIHMSLSLNEDVKLKTVENAWKPNRLVTDPEKSEDDKLTEELYKNVRGILNKLTPQKFDTLMKKFMSLPINSEQRLKGVINLIFEKAVDEPNFSKAYANMCKICSRLEVTKIENGSEQRVNFRKILITRCQTEFESNKPAVLDTNKWMEEIKNCSDPEKKKDLQLQYEEKERQMRMKSVGNIRFIGELFKLGMLTPAIMYRCIEHLLNTPEEESLECLCKLLTTIGKDLELGSNNTKGAGHQHASLNPYFQRMTDLAQKRDSSKSQVSSRVRFMLQDVIDLRMNKWVPRREDNNPKTIEQINKEAERESMEMTIALNQQPPRMNRQNDRQDDRKRGGNRNMNNNQSDDGWTNVTSNSRHYHNKFSPAFEASKMQNFKSEDLTSLSLGSGSQFRFGNVGGTKAQEPKSGPMFTSNNAFSALQPRGDERKPPQSNMNRRITQTPSIERDKERQRMIQGAFESEGGRNSRGNSAQRDRPQPQSQPPSRDSSVPRQHPAEKDNREATEGVSKRDEDKNTRIIIDEKAMRLAEEKLERQTVTLFDEYLSNCSSVEDVRQDIEQCFPVDKLGSFIQKGLELALERKLGTQQKIGQLISALMDYNLFTSDILVDQLGQIYENADDIAIDVPKVWELQAHVIVPILIAEKINFAHFKAACSTVLKTPSAPKLLIPVLNFLVKEKGAGFVRNVWDSSNVSLKDFLPNDGNLDAFIKENSLEYLTGDAPKYDTSSNQLSMDQVQEKLLRLMQSSQPYEKILDFISSNVGEKVKDLQFIRALIIAICESNIAGSNFNLNINRFRQYEKLIQRFVDNNEDRELACLSAVHILMLRLEHPQGLIKNIFNLFFEDNLISCESFLKWKDDTTDKLENKGVSLLLLTSFFSALEEAETDDENS